MTSIDVNGDDNTPEWGTCKAEGCKEDAFPIWLAGEYPDDPDLLLCPKHIGARILHEETARNAWTVIGARADDLKSALESQLGTALAEIARLEAALRMAAGMKSIKGARRVVAEALGEKEH